MNIRLNKNYIGIIIIFFGFFVSLIAIFLFGINKVSFPDAKDYLFAAEEISKGNGYPRQGSFPFFRPPLYPVFISIVWFVFPSSIAAIKISQAVLHGLTGYLIHQSGIKMFGKNLPVVLGSLFYLFNPFFIMQVIDIQTESLFTFLISLTFFISVKIYKSNKFSYFLYSMLGITLGMASLCRPSAFPLGIVFITILLLLKQEQLKLKIVFLEIIFSLLCFFAVIMPWTLYNKYSTNEWIFINDASGYNLWASNHPESIVLYEKSFATPKEFIDCTIYTNEILASEKIKDWENTQNYSSLSLKKREQLWQKEALKNGFENSYVTIRLILWKTWGFWRPYLNPEAYSFKTAFFSGIFLLSLYLFSLIGFVTLWREYDWNRFLVLLVVFSCLVTILHAVVFSMMRYRIPYIDPYLCMFAGLGFNVFFTKIIESKIFDKLKNIYLAV